jgi:HlyD family secretion protein
MQLPFINQVSKKSAPWLVGLLATGTVGTLVVGGMALRNAAPKQPIAEYTVPAQRKAVTVRITANADVVPVRKLNLNPKAAGRLAELLIEQGDRVQQGQIVARMDNRELLSQRNQAVAELARAQSSLDLLKAGNRPEAIGQASATVNQARAEVASAEARLALASQRVQRNQNLATEGAISRDRLDEVLNDERSARANLEQTKARLNNTIQQLNQQQNGARSQEIDQARAQVAAAQATLQGIDTQLEDTVIRAPFAGVITQRNAIEGDFVTPTSFSSTTSAATSIATLASDLEILAKVPEVDIAQIKPGQPVEIRTDAFPDRTFKGSVRLVSPEAKEDPTQRGVITFEVRVRLLDGKDQLRSGMTTDLAFLGKKMTDALMVPTVAIVTNKGQTGVLVPDGKNQPTFQPVTIGSTIGNETQIIDGIEADRPVFVQLPEGKKFQDVIKGMDK